MKVLKIRILLAGALVATLSLQAQHYTALQGSVYAGALGIQENPASAVSSPFPWDVTIMGLQAMSSTNALEIRNYSLFSSPAQSQYLLKGGQYARYSDINFNLNLLNLRVALNRRQTVAIGINVKNYGQVRSSAYGFVDTLHNSADFMHLNPATVPLSGQLTQSGWIELQASYAQTLMDRPGMRLQGGASLKLSRGLSGATASVSQVSFGQADLADPPRYLFTQARWEYGYSANYDRWQSGRSTGENLQNFMEYTEGGVSVDLGLEYLVRDPVAAPVLERDSYYDYRWKFGLSFLDLGFNQYKYGVESRTGNGIRDSITSEVLDARFDNVGSMRAFNDSLSTIAINNRALRGVTRVLNPARMVLNADRNIRDHFFVNGNLSINLGRLAGKKFRRVSDMSFLTITPRWETRRLGVYVPMQVNTHQQFWIGLGLKAGPLLIGIHNLGHLFSNRSFPNGGGYIALIFRSPGQTKKTYDRRLDCPPGTDR